MRHRRDHRKSPATTAARNGNLHLCFLYNFRLKTIRAAPRPAPAAKFFFPRQFRTPSTNSFAYSQSELHDMNMNDLRLRNKSTHARVLVIYCGEEKDTQDAYNQIYVQKWRPSTAIQFVQILYYALIDIQRPLSLILNNYAG